MKNLFLVLLFAVLQTPLFGQFGINASYCFNDAPDWQGRDLEIVSQDAQVLADGFAFGIDYWFRLKNQRIEFLPELNFARFAIDETVDFTVTNYSLFFNTNIYFLDFQGDCDCPTWSKEGPTLEKGLYFQLSPGITYIQQEIETIISTLDDSELAFSLGAGLGFDIGISDLITITPNAGVRYFFPTNWEDLEILNLESSDSSPPSTESTNLQFHAGIRLGFRFDQ
ncbi:MAG: autotransporter outer membrane beta-barrel domain-containing protein [Bacteroidota bacterium]